jgi:hypothetical protein
MPDLIGRTLGHCRVVEQIGAGVMVEVHHINKPSREAES